MSLFVDTSVWSLALRRDHPGDCAEVDYLFDVLDQGGPVYTTGLILQELLQGFRGARDHDGIVSRFAALPYVTPKRSDHIDAARLRNVCRQQGAQVGTIDALFAQLCIKYELTMLTTDRDFSRIAEVCSLDLWHR